MLIQGPEGTWYACGTARVEDVESFLARLDAIAARHDDADHGTCPVEGQTARQELRRATRQAAGQAVPKAACQATCQAVRADAVAGKAHLDYCVAKALRAHRRGENLAQGVGLEVLLYLRGRRQINRALELGIARGENRLVVVCAGRGARAAAGEVVELLTSEDTLAFTREKRDFLLRLHGVTPEELDAAGEDAIPLLCRERAALLDLDK